MLEIARIDPTACDELAKEIAKKQPRLKAVRKSAEGILAYLQNLNTKKGKDKRKPAPLFDIASSIAQTDVDADEPRGWNVLQQAGEVPKWAMLAQAAVDVCKRCELQDIPSSKMCSACTAAQLLAEVTLLSQDKGKDTSSC